jgi:signal transduction histidine kinase/DNA-binding response OmpR family regulator
MNLKKLLRRLLINIFTSGKHTERGELGMTDYSIRYGLLNFMAIGGSVFIAEFTVMYFHTWGLFSLASSYILILIALLCFALARTKMPLTVPALILMISYGLFCSVHIWDGKAQDAGFLYVYMYPVGTIMILGMRSGVLLSMTLLVLMAAQFFLPGLSKTDYPFAFSASLLIGYGEVFLIMVVIEIARKNKDRLIETQNRQLQELSEEAEKANRAKSDFLTTMSHEIRTPLNAVIGLSEIELRDNSLAEASKDNITRIHQSGSALLEIINDILDISKIETGHYELVPEAYDPAALISGAVNLNRVRIASKPVGFVLEINGDLPRKLRGDKLRVKQLLNNLLSNAVKYTRKGTVTLSVTWERIDTPSVLLRFAVRDTGIGIRAEDREKLFTRYTRLDTGANRETEGTGLGLTIAKNLAEMMGGSIMVESEYGKGSCFTAEIVQSIEDTAPIGEENAQNLRSFRYVSESDDIARAYIPSGGFGGDKTVLVVDDVPENLIVAQGLLAPYGFRVDTAASGHQAIERVKNNNYDIIFMDHMMPEMDGVETAAAIKAWERSAWENQCGVSEETNTTSFTEGKTRSYDGDLHRQIPIIAMTANALRGMKEFYLEQGFHDYLSKPLSPQALDQVINGQMRKAETEKSDERGGGSFASAMEAQRVDMLNHYRESFSLVPEAEWQKKFDKAYFDRFTALIESFITAGGGLSEQAALLAEAGRQGDVLKIREILPAFYDALKRHALQKHKNSGNETPNDNSVREILAKLKKAIQNGETKTAETVLGEMGTMSLSPDGKALYFLLYHFMLTGENEKALGAIMLGEKWSNHD